MNTFFKKILPILLILIGNTTYGLGVILFVLPTGLITGGTTGLGVFFQHSLGLSLNIFIAVFNVAMFLLGVWILGKKFAITTIVSTFYYPVAFQVMTSIVGDTVLTTDPMLATACAGIMIGAGIGLVIRSGASTGGMDIPPLVFNKLFGVPVSAGLYAFDFLILILQMFFSNTEQVLYGIMMIFIYTFVLDRMLVIGNNRVEVKIVSPHYEEINRRIQTELDRGVTLMDIQGGHLRQESHMILSVLSNRELVALKNLVTNIDPNAFMVISQVKEVRGLGFTIDKKHYQ